MSSGELQPVTPPKAARAKSRRSNIRDVAKGAGVSISTVSRALRGYADISPATRERVVRTSRELGYTPDAAGQNLKSGLTHTVAVLVSGNHGPALLDHYYADVLGGIEACLEAHDLSLLVVRIHTESAQRRVLGGGKADGVIALGCDLPLAFLKQLHGAGTPLVLADSSSWNAQIPSVTVANEVGGYLATKHLSERGRKHIAFIAETPGDLNFTLRQRGYERALREAGLPICSDLVEAGTLGLEGGYLAAKKLLAQTRPDALFAANDTAAFGALRAFAEHDLRVPEEVALVGFDDIELSRYTTPPLTTLHVPRQQLGFQAATKLLDLLAGERPEALELSVSLVIRSS